MRAPELDTAPITYEEYLGWPETNVPVEFVDGWPIVGPSPHPRHQRVVTKLAGILDGATPPDLVVLVSPLDWVLRRAPLHIRQPDLLVVTAAQLDQPRLYDPPLLAVEVVSPTSRERDLVHKRAAYAKAGLVWYWLVDVERPHVVVLRNDGGSFVIHASATGHEVLTVAEPFAVDLRPADLA